MPPEDPAPPPPPPARRFTDAPQGRVTVLRENLTVKGELTGAEALELAGQFEGPLEVEGLFHLRESGRVTGPVRAGHAVIEGEVEGPLTVRGRIELRASARVRGDMEAGSVALAEGCYFGGHINMGGDDSNQGPTSFQEKRSPSGSSEVA
jgi:cytoskeletal protein CcmA (bactofilin family)